MPQAFLKKLLPSGVGWQMCLKKQGHGCERFPSHTHNTPLSVIMYCVAVRWHPTWHGLTDSNTVHQLKKFHQLTCISE